MDDLGFSCLTAELNTGPGLWWAAVLVLAEGLEGPGRSCDDPLGGGTELEV